MPTRPRDDCTRSSLPQTDEALDRTPGFAYPLRSMAPSSHARPEAAERKSCALRYVAALALAIVWMCPASAVAQPSDGAGASAAAEALFQEGRRLFDAKNYAEACPKFAESHKLEPKQGTLLNLAVCHEQDGKTARAWAEFKSVITLARNSGRKDREDFARERARALEAKLSRLRVTFLEQVDGVVVKLDGNAFTPAMLSVALPIDPGKVTVVVEAPNRKPWQSVVEVPPGPVTVPLVVPALEAAPAAQPTPTPTPTPVPTPGPGDAPDEDPEISPLVYVGFGVAGAGLIVGAIGGGLTLAKSSELDDLCPNEQCTAAEQEELDQAETFANVSNVGFVVAGVGAIVGVVGVVLSIGGDDEGANSGEARIRPFITPTGLGVYGQF